MKKVNIDIEEDKFTILLKLLQSNEKSKDFLTVIIAENVFSIKMYCNAKGPVSHYCLKARSKHWK